MTDSLAVAPEIAGAAPPLPGGIGHGAGGRTRRRALPRRRPHLRPLPHASHATEARPERLAQLAQRYGAAEAFDPAGPDTAGGLEARAPGGFDVVFEAGGAAAGVPAALRLARPGGRVVLLGSTRGPVDAFDPYCDVHVKGLTILGAHVSTTPVTRSLHERWTEAANRELILRLLGDGELDVAPLVTDRVPPSGAPDAFRRPADAPSDHLGVLIDWTGA